MPRPTPASSRSPGAPTTTSVPETWVSPLSGVAGVPLNPEAADALVAMAAAARAQGAPFVAVSGYRSLDDQRRIFLDELALRGRQRIGRAYTNGEIASGAADAAITRRAAPQLHPGLLVAPHRRRRGPHRSRRIARGLQRHRRLPLAVRRQLRQRQGVRLRAQLPGRRLGHRARPRTVGVHLRRGAHRSAVPPTSCRSPTGAPVAARSAASTWSWSRARGSTAVGWTADPDAGGTRPRGARLDRRRGAGRAGRSQPAGRRGGDAATAPCTGSRPAPTWPPGPMRSAPTPSTTQPVSRARLLGCTVVDGAHPCPGGQPRPGRPPRAPGSRSTAGPPTPTGPTSRSRSTSTSTAAPSRFAPTSPGPMSRRRHPVRSAATATRPGSALPAGAHTVCAFAISPQPTEGNPRLGCRSAVSLGTDAAGNLDRVVAEPGGVRVDGLGGRRRATGPGPRRPRLPRRGLRLGGHGRPVPARRRHRVRGRWHPRLLGRRGRGARRPHGLCVRHRRDPGRAPPPAGVPGGPGVRLAGGAGRARVQAVRRAS